MQSFGRLFDQPDPCEFGPCGEAQFDDIVAPKGALAGEGLEDQGSAAFTGRYEAARVQRAAGAARCEVHDFDRLIESYPRCDV